jgi:hypothetical protein
VGRARRSLLRCDREIEGHDQVERVRQQGPGKLKTVATDKATLASFAEVGTGVPVVFHAVTTAFDPLKSVFFAGKHAAMDFRMDEAQ